MLITLLSLFSFSGIDTTTVITIPHMDKIIHFTFYLVFVVLGFFFYGERFKKRSQLKKVIFSIVIIAIIYGMLIEVLQYVMPYDREADFFDILANSIGSIFGGLLIKKYLSLNRKLK